MMKNGIIMVVEEDLAIEEHRMRMSGIKILMDVVVARCTMAEDEKQGTMNGIKTIQDMVAAIQSSMAVMVKATMAEDSMAEEGMGGEDKGIEGGTDKLDQLDSFINNCLFPLFELPFYVVLHI